MLYKETAYVAKVVDSEGNASYSSEENDTWSKLFVRQNAIVQGRACDEFIEGLAVLDLPPTRVPQCPEVTEVLQATTGWTLEPVPALISFDHFFELLANKRFPAATFIRKREELDYIKEPDIFHEIFGHCPLLTNPAYAEFTHTYGKLGLKATPQERVLLARLFWFTIEFGLIDTTKGLRAYGGGILSSKNETIYCLESEIPERRPLNVIDALQTAYRIDVIQPIYFVIKDFDELYRLIDLDLISLVRKIRAMNEDKPRHPC
jgi:phenylalanine-4-hydroxylase